jgi:hypothetical protein
MCFFIFSRQQEEKKKKLIVFPLSPSHCHSVSHCHCHTATATATLAIYRSIILNRLVTYQNARNNPLKSNVPLPHCHCHSNQPQPQPQPNSLNTAPIPNLSPIKMLGTTHRSRLSHCHIATAAATSHSHCHTHRHSFPRTVPSSRFRSAFALSSDSRVRARSPASSENYSKIIEKS